MVVVFLPDPVLLTVDVALDRGCLETWGPPEPVNRILAGGLLSFVPAVLVVLASRPEAGPPRRSRRGRLACAAIAARRGHRGAGRTADDG